MTNQFFKFVLTVLTFCSFVSYSQNQILPTDILFKKNKQFHSTISPNGKFYAHVNEVNKSKELVIIDIDSLRIHQRIPMGDESIDNLYWLNSKRLMYESIGEILALDIDGNNGTIIQGRIGDKRVNSMMSFYKNLSINGVFSLWPKNENEILVESYDYSGYASIKRVNVFTGNSVQMISGKKHKVLKWLGDSYGNVRMALKVDDDQVLYHTYDPESKELEPLKIRIADTILPVSISADRMLNLSVVFEDFSQNEDLIYISSNVGTDKWNLLEYDLKKQEVTRTLLEDVLCDIKNPMNDDAYIIPDFKNKMLGGIKYESIQPTFKWFSDDLKVIHDSLSQKFPRMVNEILDTDANYNRFVVHQWSDVKAGNVGIYDHDSGQYTIVIAKNPELDKFSLSKTKTLIAIARDGYKVPCYVNFPTRSNENNTKPLIVIPHGGPWARDYWELDKFVQYFTNRGYTTLKVNFRGSAGFGKEHLLSGVNSMDEVMIDDIVDATTTAIEKFNLDPENVFLFGHSYGGYATYMSLIRYPELFNSGVALAAPSNLKKWMKIQKREGNDFAYEFWKTALGSKKRKYLEKISPYYQAERLTSPILMFHGKLDEIIPYEQSEEMEVELKKYNSNVNLEILKNEGHSISDSNSWGYILNTSNSFFRTTSK